MYNAFSNIAWLSVLAAFMAYFVIGALWFTLLFPKPYRFSLGKENEVAEKPAPIFIIGPAICSLVITIATAIFMEALHVDSMQGALSFAFVAGFGYLVANTVNIAINPNIPRPLLYGLISGSYHMAGMLTVCSILYLMK